MAKIIFLFFVLLPVASFGGGNDYSVTASVTQRGNKIEIGGRINSGPKCNNVIVNSTAISDQGQAVTIYASTSYSGWGSSLFEGKQEIYLNRKGGLPSWKIVQTLVSCGD